MSNNVLPTHHVSHVISRTLHLFAAFSIIHGAPDVYRPAEFSTKIKLRVYNSFPCHTVENSNLKVWWRTLCQVTSAVNVQLMSRIRQPAESYRDDQIMLGLGPVLSRKTCKLMRRADYKFTNFQLMYINELGVAINDSFKIFQRKSNFRPRQSPIIVEGKLDKIQAGSVFPCQE